MTVDAGWRTLAEVQAAVRFADSKATAELALAGVLTGFVIQAGPSDVHSGLRLIVTGLWFSALAILAASIIQALLALLPRGGSANSASLIYFADVSRYRQLQDYRSEYLRLLESGEEALLEQVTDQVWWNSHIATHKFFHVGWSARFLALGVPLSLLALAGKALT